MKQPLPILLIECLALGIAGYAVWVSILDRWREPLPPDLIQKGRKEQLQPGFRRRLERSIPARIGRMMFAVEVAAKRIAHRR